MRSAEQSTPTKEGVSTKWDIHIHIVRVHICWMYSPTCTSIYGIHTRRCFRPFWMNKTEMVAMFCHRLQSWEKHCIELSLCVTSWCFLQQVFKKGTCPVFQRVKIYLFATTMPYCNFFVASGIKLTDVASCLKWECMGRVWYHSYIRQKST